MKLFFDERDDHGRGAERISWLEDVGARPLIEADDHERGFIFSLTPELDAYRRAIAGRPDLDDQAGERAPIDRFDRLLETLKSRGLQPPSPRLWRPEDGPKLPFPLELRPRAGLRERPARAVADAAALDRALAELGEEGLLAAPLPRRPGRLRLWVADGRPCVWSREQDGEGPVEAAALAALARASASYAAPFGSRLIAFDFARQGAGWILEDAGPGSRALTRSEVAFKAAAEALLGRHRAFEPSLDAGPVPRAWLC